ncbi:CASP2 [Mytilus coruscus]|uniref:CASP2 n=1 Tax=Mytilus coruscus TaxID=42192 RepID=A0A6J8EBN6_MYTCO|nr:CASP2 [Mytilus coruscus]
MHIQIQLPSNIGKYKAVLIQHGSIIIWKSIILYNSMDKKDKRTLLQCRTKLVEDLDVQPVLDHLFEAGILTADQVERISGNDTSARKNRALIDILPRRGPTAFKCFLESLINSDQSHLNAYLLSKNQDNLSEVSSQRGLSESVQQLNINDNQEDESSRTPFLQLQFKEKLEEFFIRVVRPDRQFVSRCKNAIDIVSKTIIKEFKNCSKIFVGGSLGKETDVRSFSDVDILLELKDVKSVVDLAGRIDDILTGLAGHLEKFTDKNVELSFEGKTKYAIQFNIKAGKDNEWIKVDLLPIVNVWNNCT